MGIQVMARKISSSVAFGGRLVLLRSSLSVPKVKSRWACLPLDFRFYMMQKDIEKKGVNVTRKGKVVPFDSKMEQAANMLKEVQEYYQQPVLAVTDSWFGNNGLWLHWTMEQTESFICFLGCGRILRCITLRRSDLMKSAQWDGHQNTVIGWVVLMSVRVNGKNMRSHTLYFFTASKGKFRLTLSP